MTDTKENEFVTATEALALIPFPVERGAMVRMSATGAFPAAIKINARHWLWRRADVIAWVRERWTDDSKNAKRAPDARLTVEDRLQYASRLPRRTRRTKAARRGAARS